MTSIRLMDFAKTTAFMDRIWDDEIIPALTDYIRIPNKSPAFDPDWEEHGHMEQAVELFAAWAQGKAGALSRRGAGSGAAARPHAADLHRSPGHAPGTVLMYGHLDKQPEMMGWAEGSGPVAAGAEGRQALWPRRRR